MHHGMWNDEAGTFRQAESGPAASNRLYRSARETAAGRPRKSLQPEDDSWQLRRASDMFIVGQMAGGIAHDFNNRLQGVMSMLNVMRARIGQGRAAECDALADAAQNSLLQAGHLAHRLLSFARADEAVRSMVDVNNAIASVEVVLKCLTGRRIDVSMELGAGSMLAFCDGHQLESVLFNLVVNARDAIPDRGRICIETSHAELTAETPSLKRGRYVCVSVSDTGCGMTKEVIGRAFDPFFTTKPPGKGTGLGLPMVKAFVDQSEGHIDAQSAEGLGTTIAVYLPSASA